MIIPKIEFTTQLDAYTLVDQLRHWSLFGPVALTGIGPDDVETLEPVIKRVGGSMDLLVRMTHPTEVGVLALLNAGAKQLIDDQPRASLDEIPRERIAFVISDESPDEAIPKGCLVWLTQPTSERIAELEMARVDCLIDVELLSAELIADFLKQVLVSDRPDGLWSTLIVDPLGIALGLAYSNHESLLHALEMRCGTYWSRSRDELWIKGESSGATQQLRGIRLDCDRDCLKFTVTQDPPGFCHRNTHSCFGEERTIQSVIQRLSERIADSDEQSFTRKLAHDPVLLEKKLLEEAQELADASQSDDQQETAWEAADVLYFSLVAMLKNGVSLDQVYDELARRMNRVVRRDPGIKS